MRERGLWQRLVGCGALGGAMLCISPVYGAVVVRDSAASPATKVDPFIGVDWGGNTFVGSTVPFGMVKLGPDVESFDGRRSGFGYASYGKVLGFSHLHLSGAQGKYGNILVMPTTGAFKLGDVSSARTSETAKVGYYATTLGRYGVRAELTSSRRVGLHRYTFLRGGESHVVLDVAHAISMGTGWEDQRFLGAEVHVTGKREARGVARFTGGWNRGGPYKVFYNFVLQAPAEGVRTWVRDAVSGDAVSGEADASTDAGKAIGAVFDLHTRPGQVLEVKIGISFVSAEQAAQNVMEEMPGWNFEQVRAETVALWNKELRKLQMVGASADQQTKLYTAMYHVMLMPVDRTGENPLWVSTEPYYDDFYAIWDTFRSSSPLLTLISPERERDLVRSLIDIYRHEGYLPDARSGNDTGRTQGGSNADVVIADAYVKGLEGIDYKAGLAGMIHDAEVPPADPQKEGRGGLKDYNRRGYVTLADERSGSRTVEYAYDDFAIAEVACGLGMKQEARTYAGRAHNFENLFDRSMEVSGFKGFLRPKNPDGSWAAPYMTVRGTWPDFMYEGDIWTYTLYAPQDMRKMIEMTGGKSEFMRRLDFTFGRGHFDVTNEPGFLMPTLYDYAGRPDKTADVVHLLLEKYFTTGRAGIPGNDDSGAMSSWLLFQTMGIYPVAGQDVYLIGTPSLPEMSLRLGPGKWMRVVAKGLDGQGLNRYVEAATLNGKALDEAWFRHGAIKDGATLVFTMGSSPSPTWGRGTPPPSMSDPGREGCWE